jgi:hypothetical protein
VGPADRFEIVGDVHLFDPVTVLEDPAASQTSPDVDLYFGVAVVEFIDCEQFTGEPVKEGRFWVCDVVEIEIGLL